MPESFLRLQTVLFIHSSSFSLIDKVVCFLLWTLAPSLLDMVLWTVGLSVCAQPHHRHDKHPGVGVSLAASWACVLERKTPLHPHSPFPNTSVSLSLCRPGALSPHSHLLPPLSFPFLTSVDPLRPLDWSCLCDAVTVAPAFPSLSEFV